MKNMMYGDAIIIKGNNIFLGDKIYRYLNKKELDIKIEEGKEGFVDKKYKYYLTINFLTNKDIQIVQIYDSPYPIRIDINIENNVKSSLRYYKRAFNLDGDSLNDSVININLKRDTKLNLINDVNFDEKTSCFVFFRIDMDKSSELNLFEKIASKGNIKERIDIALKEKAKARISSRLYSYKEGSIDMKYNVIHLMPKTESKIVNKALVKNKSKIISNVLVKMTKGAYKSKTDIHQKGMLLEQGNIEFIPGLEIHTKDVKATHRANTTRLRDEDIFYMQSRGFSKKNIKEIIIKKFLCNGDLYVKGNPKDRESQCMY